METVSYIGQEAREPTITGAHKTKEERSVQREKFRVEGETDGRTGQVEEKNTCSAECIHGTCTVPNLRLHCPRSLECQAGGPG